MRVSHFWVSGLLSAAQRALWGLWDASGCVFLPLVLKPLSGLPRCLHEVSERSAHGRRPEGCNFYAPAAISFFRARAYKKTIYDEIIPPYDAALSRRIRPSISTPAGINIRKTSFRQRGHPCVRVKTIKFSRSISCYGDLSLSLGVNLTGSGP